MKSVLAVLAFFFTVSGYAQNTAAYFNSFPSYYRCGDISVSGTQLTVEALIKKNGTGPLLSTESSPNIVSKHQFPSDANYILRMEHAEITTSNGFFYTPVTPALQSSFYKDSFYHVAMTYDGAALKFYVNGCLFTQIPVTGNLATNSFPTTIAQMAGNPTGFSTEQWFGYIDEVRIWNVVRTQTQIQANMKNLPSPTTQAGLLAYYKFEGNSVNVQGNPAFNATPFGSPVLLTQTGWDAVKPFNAGYTVTNAYCGANGSIAVNAEGGKTPYRFSKDGVNYQSSNLFSNLAPGTYTINARSDNNGCGKDTTITIGYNCVTASFTSQDTVCVNIPVNFVNTSIGATTYNWGFCGADLKTAPAAVNLGNIGGAFSNPDFMDYGFYNGNYYGFVTNHFPGNLIRLNFGNSLTNTPTATVLGNFGGAIPSGYGTQGIQVVQNEGKWYAIIVGGYVPSGSTPRIVKIEFGPALDNNSPTATNWGNIGNMVQPMDISLFKEGNNWYGLTVNASGNTITRFNFSSSFDNVPTATDLGNIGALSYPTGIYAVNDNNFWRVFVTNGGNSSTTTGPWSLSRLDFGSSLLNTPTGVNLGNPGNALQHPRDLVIIKGCGEPTGFAVNARPGNDALIRLDFPNSLSAAPVITSLGNIGNLNFPHSFSKLARDGNNLYAFITNGNGNTITRVSFNGCNNSSIATSNVQNPPAVTYNAPGIYNINLTVDEGLPTQASVCRQVVVLAALNHTPTATFPVCIGDSIKLGRNYSFAQYAWSTGATTDSIFIKTPGIYYIDISRYGCSVRDSFIVTQLTPPVLSLTKSNDVNCARPTTILSAAGASVYTWTPGPLSGATVSVSPKEDTWYVVMGTDANGCKSKDSIKVIAKFRGPNDFYIPNAFTPNGDGLNDCFGVHYWQGVSDFTLMIYDKWGVEVFRTTNATQCWDGSYKGKRQGNARFVYYIKANTACGPVVKKGTFVLLR